MEKKERSAFSTGLSVPFVCLFFFEPLTWVEMTFHAYIMPISLWFSHGYDDSFDLGVKGKQSIARKKKKNFFFKGQPGSREEAS